MWLRILLLLALVGVVGCGVGLGDLEVGDCIVERGYSGEAPESVVDVERINVVPCEEDHDFVVLSIHTLTDMESYPSTVEWNDLAWELCPTRFDEYYLSLELQWQRGERYLVCLEYE